MNANVQKLNPHSEEPQRSNWRRGFDHGQIGSERDDSASGEYHSGYDAGIAIFRMRGQTLPSRTRAYW